MEGWVKLDRKIINHWIYADDAKFKWWVTLVMLANHEPRKILIKGVLVEIARGDLVRSYESLAALFMVSKKTVKVFLELLQKDGMVRLENLKVSTRITICNYGSYQDSVNADSPDKKRQVNAQETESKRQLPTNNNVLRTTNNLKNEKKPPPSDFVDPNQIYRQHYKIL